MKSPMPTYSELRKSGRPAGTSWGLWGDDDQVGALNRITPEAVAAAARLVHRGVVFPLDWGYSMPDPVLFSRGPIEHVVQDRGFSLDDHFNRFFPHGGTHWDALNHFSHPEHGYYGGRSGADVQAPDAQNSIAEWAKRGVVTRFVLADVARWRASVGRPLDYGGSEHVPVDDVRATLETQGSEVEVGDILLVRLGWVNWYLGLDAPRRQDLSTRRFDFVSPGLSPARELVEWVWDSGIVAVACDNPAVDALPFEHLGQCLHADLKAALGISLGELFVLDALAEDCADDGRYAGMLTSAPMNYVGATGSPANALAIK